MKKIRIEVSSNTTTGGFSLLGKGNNIHARCAGREIEWSKRGIIEASLKLNKALRFEVTPTPNKVEVRVVQKDNTLISKTFTLEMKSDELFIDNITSGMKKIESFIISIENYFKELEVNSIQKTTLYTIGGN